MLFELSRSDLFKNAGETPYEFLIRIEKNMPEIAAEARVITESFCEVKYAETALGPENMRILRICVEILKQKKKKSAPFIGRPS